VTTKNAAPWHSFDGLIDRSRKGQIDIGLIGIGDREHDATFDQPCDFGCIQPDSHAALGPGCDGRWRIHERQWRCQTHFVDDQRDGTFVLDDELMLDERACQHAPEVEVAIGDNDLRGAGDSGSGGDGDETDNEAEALHPSLVRDWIKTQLREAQAAVVVVPVVGERFLGENAGTKVTGTVGICVETERGQLLRHVREVVRVLAFRAGEHVQCVLGGALVFVGRLVRRHEVMVADPPPLRARAHTWYS
jgi:hypothetical protein